MDVIALSPLRTGSVVWQPRRGSWVLTAVCKATFSLAQTESTLAEEQEYPNEDDNHWNDDPARSLYSPSDLVPYKPRADVMVVGHAFAPRKEPARSVVARIIVGEMSKAIEVWCDRSVAQDGSLREGPRFVKMPLRWERAAGGVETQNPVGMRLDARPDAYGTVAVPNLQPPGMIVTSLRDFIEPVCFGPIAATWAPRRDRLGRHAGTWSPSWSQQPMPEDIDPGFFNAAPRDQQVEGLRANERIILENLHPEHARLVTNLPGVSPRAFVDRRGAPPQELSFVCDTMWIDTDRAICTLTWRAQVPIEHPAQPGRVLIASEHGQRLAWADVERMAAAHEAASTETTSPRMEGFVAPKPVEGPPRVKAQTLPFMRSTPDFAMSPPPPEPPKPRLSRVRDRLQETRDDTSVGPATVMRPSLESATDASPPWLAQARAALGAVPASPPTFDPAVRPVSAPSVPPGSPFGAPPTRPPQPATPFVPVPRPSDPSMPALRSPAESIVMRAPDPPAVMPPPQVLPPQVVQPSFVSVDPAPPPVVNLASPSIGMAMAPLGREPSSGGPPVNMGAIAPPAPVALPAPVMVSTAVAATVGVTAVSNAAAANARAAAQQQAAAAPQPTAAPAAPQPKSGTKAREIVDLLWFDPPALPRIRARDEWKAILDGAKPDGAKKPKKKSLSFDDDDEDDAKASAPAKDPPGVADRRDLSTILARGDALEPDWLSDAINEAVGDDGSFMPPLVLTGGELVFPFDEVEQLKAMVTAVGPFVGSDKKLKEAVDNAKELLDAQALAGGGSGVAEGLTNRIREAFQQTTRMVPPTYPDTQSERALLEQRHYQKRTVFGAPWVRALIAVPGGGNGVPSYLPEELAKQLPMFQRFRAKLIAEVHLAQDQYETSTTALKVVAVARVMPIGIGAGAGAKAGR